MKDVFLDSSCATCPACLPGPKTTRKLFICFRVAFLFPLSFFVAACASLLTRTRC